MPNFRDHKIFVPLWRPVAQAFLDAFLGVLLGIAIITNKHSLTGPAYHPIAPLGRVLVGMLFLVPGIVTCTLLIGGHRKNAFIPLLCLSGVYAMFTALLSFFSIANPGGWEGAALFGIFSASTLLMAFTAADLP